MRLRFSTVRKFISWVDFTSLNTHSQLLWKSKWLLKLWICNLIFDQCLRHPASVSETFYSVTQAITNPFSKASVQRVITSFHISFPSAALPFLRYSKFIISYLSYKIYSFVSTENNFLHLHNVYFLIQFLSFFLKKWWYIFE